LNRPQKPTRWEKERVVATCSESRSNPSSRVLYLSLHLLPLEPLVDAILMVQLHPGRNTSALVGSVLFLVLAALLLSLLTVLLSHLLLGDALLLGVARVRCIQ